MSRIRIYELAKEAGMSSKVLADKLLEQGYDIKGHSSTVDDETAEKIRDTILKSTDTELVEKRISGKAGSAVIRRRAKTIKKPEVEEVLPEVEEIDTEADAAAVDDAQVKAGQEEESSELAESVAKEETKES